MRPMSRRRAWASAAVALSLASLGSCSKPPPRPANVDPAGTFVVLSDSSRVSFVYVRDGQPWTGTLTRIVGSLTFREVTRRRLLVASGNVAADLGSLVLGDSAQARALSTALDASGARLAARTAELRIRELFGKTLTSRLPPGGIAPIEARGQLRTHGMAVSRPFQGEISRTPSGYRLTTSVPALVSVGELGLRPVIDAWLQATGGGAVDDGVALVADLRLARRPDVADDGDR